MKTTHITTILVVTALAAATACKKDKSEEPTTVNSLVCEDNSSNESQLHSAFSEFDTSRFEIYVDGNEIVLQTNGLPNHTSPYWSNTTERCSTGPNGNVLCTNSNTTVNHPLFVPPTVTDYQSMAPGNIDDFNGTLLYAYL